MIIKCACGKKLRVTLVDVVTNVRCPNCNKHHSIQTPEIADQPKPTKPITNQSLGSQTREQLAGNPSPSHALLWAIAATVGIGLLILTIVGYLVLRPPTPELADGKPAAQPVQEAPDPPPVNVEHPVSEIAPVRTEADPTEPDPTKPDPTKPDPTKPDPTKPDPTEPDPTEPVEQLELPELRIPPQAEAATQDNSQPEPKEVVRPNEDVAANVDREKPQVAVNDKVGKPAVPLVDSRGLLSDEALKHLKAATVFVMSGDPKRDPKAGTGSGFLIGQRDGRGYIVTNAHVVEGFSTVKVAFNSGSPEEYVLPAKVVIDRESVDIAVLEIRAKTGKPLPKEISLQANLELRETLEVFVLGYPFGRLLGGSRQKNPAPTVGRGFVSSLRKNDQNEIIAIQIDGAINPGNSGGPILDREGRLVGIATATVPGAQIGLAVPTQYLKRILTGRISKFVSRISSGTENSTVIEVVADTEDPLGKLAEVSVIYAPRPKGYKTLKPDAIGNFERVEFDADTDKELKLTKKEDLKYEEEFTVKGDADKSEIYLIQPVTKSEDDRIKYHEPLEIRIGFGKSRKTESVQWPGSDASDDRRIAKNEEDDWLGSPNPRKPGSRTPRGAVPRGGEIIQFDPVVGASVIDDRSSMVSDLNVSSILLPADQLISNLVWSTNRKSFFVLSKTGILLKISFPEFKIEKIANLEQPCTWLGMTKRGVCVSAGSDQELVVFDERNLKENFRVVVPTPLRFASGENSDNVFIVSTSRSSEMSLVDLSRKEVVASFKTRDFKTDQSFVKHPKGVVLSEFKMPTMTPDGKYLFCVGFECLHRFTIKSNRIIYDQMGPRIGSNVSRIEVSADSKYVAIPSGGGNRQQSDHPAIGSYGTYIYSVRDITSAVTSIAGGAYPRAVGFDPKAGLLYGQNFETTLISFTPKGLKQKTYKMTNRGDNVKQFLVHPSGNNLLILTEKELFFARKD